MPGETVHWEILEQVSKLGELDSDAKTCLESFPEVAALGSLAHDALYFYKAGLIKRSS